MCFAAEVTMGLRNLSYVLVCSWIGWLSACGEDPSVSGQGGAAGVGGIGGRAGTAGWMSAGCGPVAETPDAADGSAEASTTSPTERCWTFEELEASQADSATASGDANDSSPRVGTDVNDSGWSDAGDPDSGSAGATEGGDAARQCPSIQRSTHSGLNAPWLYWRADPAVLTEGRCCYVLWPSCS
jgi:hypothetical protein